MSQATPGKPNTKYSPNQSQPIAPGQKKIRIPGLILLFALFGPVALEANAMDERPTEPDPQSDRRDVSPARGIAPAPERRRENEDSQRGRETNQANAGYRTIDGSGNNETSPNQGAALTPLMRAVPADYTDGLSSLAGTARPSARLISNLVFSQTSDRPNPYGATDYLWQWGQFLDHDIDLTDGADPAEPAPIRVPVDDLFFYPDSEIALNRSHYESQTGIHSPRQQVNEITAWIDASNVYGSDNARRTALREPDSARMKTSAGNLLPFNTQGLSNAGGDSASLFLAGDVRANEQAGLTAMHTLFVREHNRYVEQLQEREPELSNEETFNRARRWVGALMQVITYQEFLPALLGPHRPEPYQGYDDSIDASIINSFSTAAYRFGHSALSSTLLRLDAEGSAIAEGHLPLRAAFFNPELIAEQNNLEPILRGLAAQSCQQIDTLVIDDVRNFLFGEPPSAGFDLVSLNIQRGRDHGLPSYNAMRVSLGLTSIDSFDAISSDPDVGQQLATTYASVDDIDLWVGGLAEDHLTGSHLGELFTLLVRRQFTALRDGDRFWYANTLTRDERRAAERTRLADVIRRNTDIGDELSDNVFSLNDPEDRQQRDRNDNRNRN